MKSIHLDHLERLPAHSVDVQKLTSKLELLTRSNMKLLSGVIWNEHP
ncbi:unnamed protein product [Brassica oleracea]